MNAATRAYDDAVMAFGQVPDHLEMMRQQLRNFSSVPLMLMISRPFGDVLEFFPELVLNLCRGSASSIYLARNMIRTLPKSEVERRVVADLESLVEGVNAGELMQLSDLLIEFGLSAAVARVRAYAAGQADEEMRRLAEDLEGVERDASRWRLSRVERIHR
jgi:hypothetical protein